MSALIDELPDETTAIAEPLRARWEPQQYFDVGFRAFVLRELDRLRELQPGWDGYRASRMDPDVIDAAREFILRLTPHIAPRPNVVPLAAGGLQFEWVQRDVALELEFESPRTVRFLKWNPAAGESEENTVGIEDQARLEALVRWFARQNV